MHSVRFTTVPSRFFSLFSHFAPMQYSRPARSVALIRFLLLAFFLFAAYCRLWEPEPEGLVADYRSGAMVLRQVSPDTPAGRAGLEISLGRRIGCEKMKECLWRLRPEAVAQIAARKRKYGNENRLNQTDLGGSYSAQKFWTGSSEVLPGDIKERICSSAVRSTVYSEGMHFAPLY